MTKKIRKILLVILIGLEIFLLNAPAVWALKIPSPTKVAKKLEARYHLNLKEMQNFGEGFNVASSKGRAPEVVVFFSPADPKPGEKVTAKAVPIYFNNETDQLYYTWYLKHKDNNDDNDGDGQKNEIDDYKIEAARIIANNGFEVDKADYNKDLDSDGYKAIYGGEGKKDMSKHCYIHDFETGIDHELTDSIYNEATYEVSCGSNERAVCLDSQINSSGQEICVLLPSESVSCDESNEREFFYCYEGTPYCMPNSLETFFPLGHACENESSLTLLDGISGDHCSLTGNLASVHEKACRHFFPNARQNDETGDGNFGVSEEKFWRTNPSDPDTADTGGKDESNVAGLGIQEFTWNYMPGDKVGVVVEGTSITPTKYGNASYMIMWAFPKNKCKPKNIGSKAVKVKGYRVTIPTATMNKGDFDKCLEDNLIDPREGGQPKNLDIALTYSPENPINDEENGSGGDIVRVQSSISNLAGEEKMVYYNWKIKIAEGGNMSLDPDDWDDITNSFNIISKTTGIGVNYLEFKLNLSNDDLENYLNNGIGYLKVNLEAEEALDGKSETRLGRSDVVIKFNSSTKKIDVYAVKVNVKDDEKLSLELDKSKPLCQDFYSQYPCPILENEIIGVEVKKDELSKFSWKLNGQPLICDSSISSSCFDDSVSNVNFIPIVGKAGDVLNLTFDANDINNPNANGFSVELFRNFKISKPYTQIVPNNDDVKRKILGNYINLDGTSSIDESDKIFQAQAEKISLKAITAETSSGENSKVYKWIVDGEEIENDNKEVLEFKKFLDDNKINKKTAGEIYNVTLEVSYIPSENIRKALFKLWGISNFTSVEKTASSHIEIETPLGEGQNSSALGIGSRIMASLAGNFSGYILFILKITLTVLVMIFTAGFVLSLRPIENPNH